MVKNHVLKMTACASPHPLQEIDTDRGNEKQSISPQVVKSKFIFTAQTGYTIQCRYTYTMIENYTNLLNFKPIVKSSSEHEQIVSNRESISMLRSVCCTGQRERFPHTVFV